MMTRFTGTHFAMAAALVTSAVALAAPPALAAPAKAMAHRNVAEEQANLKLVLYFTEAVFNQHDWSVADKFLSDHYIQHNPGVADGKEAFIAFYKRVVAANPGLHSQVLRTATSGDLVFTHARSTTDDPKHPPIAIVNIFRIEGGKIVEHWDVIQPSPPTSANTNTMF